MDDFSTLCFKRTKDGISFEAEPKKPHLGNLGTHVKTNHEELDRKGKALLAAGKSVEEVLDEGIDDAHAALTLTYGGYGPAEQKMFADFIEACQEETMVHTQSGFYMAFAAWVVEDNLPWSTGMKSGIQRIWRYLKNKWKLPSDTTVRNYVQRLFDLLVEVLVKEIMVSRHYSFPRNVQY